MALADITISFDLAQLLGSDFDPRRTKAYVTTNIESGTLMDTTTGETRLGDESVTIASDGTGSFTTWATGADGNPISWQTSLIVDYPRTGQRDRKRRVFGPWTLTTADDGKNITELEDEQAVPAEYLTTVTTQLDTKVAAAEAARDAAVDISNISTSDAVVEALVKNTGGAGPLTSAALSATYVSITQRPVSIANPAYGADLTGATDSTAALAAAFADSPSVEIPKHATVAVTQQTLNAGARLTVDGTLRKRPTSPGAILKALNAAGITVEGDGTIDGNKAAQTVTTPGEGLLDFDNCADLLIDLRNAEGNYFPLAESAANTAALLYVRNSDRAKVRRLNVSDWAREAVWLEGCDDSEVESIRGLGGADSWSGLQFSGTRNQARHIRVRDSGASGVSFDCVDSDLFDVEVIDNRYQNAINFGHVGKAAQNVRGVLLRAIMTNPALNLSATGEACGIAVVNGSSDVSIIDAITQNAKGHGLNVSADALSAFFHKVKALNAGGYGLNVFGGASGVSVTGQDLDLIGSTAGPYLFGGTSPGWFLRNVRTALGQIVPRLVSSQTPSVWVPASAMSALTGTPSLAAFNNWVAWLMDAAATEAVQMSTLLPDEWATYKIELWWAPAGAAAGAVTWDHSKSEFASGAALGSGTYVNGGGSATPGVGGQIVTTTLASGITHTPGSTSYLRVLRDAVDATDTYTADAAIVGVRFVQQS